MKQQKTVLITGSTSGFGRVCGTWFAERGWVVYGGGRSIETEQREAGMTLFPLDVTQAETLQRVVRIILDREQRLDTVICNAGFGIGGPLETTSIDEARQQFETNFFGVHRTVQAVMPVFRRQQAGQIVIIGSIGGRIGLPFQGMYSATKFALEGYAEALSMEVKAWKVQVLLVEPGDFATGFTAARRRIHTTEPYTNAFDRALHTIEQDESGGLDPQVLAKTLYRLLSRKSLPRKKMIGAWDQKLAVVLKSLLPAKGFEAIIHSHYLG